MRVETGSEAIGRKVGRPVKSMPAEGSKAARIYEALYANRGRLVDLTSLGIPMRGVISRPISDLRDYYGCDIRARRGYGHKGYVLAGEWFGSEYRDYVNEAIDAELSKPAAAAKSNETQE